MIGVPGELNFSVGNTKHKNAKDGVVNDSQHYPSNQNPRVIYFWFSLTRVGENFVMVILYKAMRGFLPEKEKRFHLRFF